MGSEQLPFVRATTKQTAASCEHRRADPQHEVASSFLSFQNFGFSVQLVSCYMSEGEAGWEGLRVQRIQNLQRSCYQGDRHQASEGLYRWEGESEDQEKCGEGFALVGRDTGVGKDCVWYGTTFCDGDLVEDLFRWWFKMKCAKGKFSVDSSSYAEVIERQKLEKLN